MMVPIGSPVARGGVVGVGWLVAAGAGGVVGELYVAGAGVGWGMSAGQG